MPKPLTGAMQYKVASQKDSQLDATQDQNRIESIEERKNQRMLQ